MMNKLSTIHDGQNDVTRNSVRVAMLRNGATKNRIRWTRRRRNEISTKRIHALSFDWRRAISQDYPAALQSRVNSIPSSEFSSRRAVSTRRRTEDEAGSPRVADRSGLLAVLPSSPLVLHERYTTTGAKRQAWRFSEGGSRFRKCR